MSGVHRDVSRRDFLARAGRTALGVSMAGGVCSSATRAEAPDPPVRSDRKVRIGVVGGGFGASFHWHEDPNCIVQAVSDLRDDRRDRLMKTYRCGRSFPSLEKLILAKDIDAVAVFTGAPDHVRHCKAVMDAGKHCLCAVPAATTLEDCRTLKEAKERNKVFYMMAETSYYRRHCIAARKLFQDGAFGELFYSEVEYYHPSGKKERRALDYYKDQRTWRYGYPPMLYPTHSTGFLVGVTKERLTEVSCLGWGNKDSERLKDNAYKNPFNVQATLAKTSQGHMCRFNVFWDGTAHGERAQWFGTRLTYYMPGSGGQPLALKGPGAPTWDHLPDFWHMVPKAMRRDSGHGGSHPFITHEFITALCENREPAVDVYESLAMTAPGIVAHASAFEGGEQMKVPSFDPGLSAGGAASTLTSPGLRRQEVRRWLLTVESSLSVESRRGTGLSPAIHGQDAHATLCAARFAPSWGYRHHGLLAGRASDSSSSCCCRWPRRRGELRTPSSSRARPLTIPAAASRGRPLRSRPSPRAAASARSW